MPPPLPYGVPGPLPLTLVVLGSIEPRGSMDLWGRKRYWLCGHTYIYIYIYIYIHIPALLVFQGIELVPFFACTKGFMCFEHLPPCPLCARARAKEERGVALPGGGRSAGADREPKPYAIEGAKKSSDLLSFP